MDKTEWVRTASDLLYKLSTGREIRMVWKDFLLWSAYQAGRRSGESKIQQKLILNDYPQQKQEMFQQLFRIVSYVTSQWPHQNILLKIMDAVHIAGKYFYDEHTAREILLNKSDCPLDSTYRWRQMELFEIEDDDSNLWENINCIHSDDMDELSSLCRLNMCVFVDDRCSISGGSRLIAVANEYREHCPMDFANRMILIASDPKDITFALISFIQMALMGMACYVLTDNDYCISLSCNMGLFAPPTAICSSAYYSDKWNEARMKAIIAAQIGGAF